MCWGWNGVGFLGDSDRPCASAESQASDELRERQDVDIGLVCGGETLGATQARTSSGELYAATLSFTLTVLGC